MTADPTITKDPECCDTPMVHNSFTSEYECANSYFVLVDARVFSEGESFLRFDLADLSPALRLHYEHWRASCVSDNT